MARIPCSGQWFRTRCPHWLLPAGWEGAICLKGPQPKTSRLLDLQEETQKRPFKVSRSFFLLYAKSKTSTCHH